MIYQAKVILVAQLNINEQQAHKQLQQTAMQKGQTIVQIANFIVQQYG
jgi:AmiR/NasT family two-component response regulator